MRESWLENGRLGEGVKGVIYNSGVRISKRLRIFFIFHLIFIKEFFCGFEMPRGSGVAWEEAGW